MLSILGIVVIIVVTYQVYKMAKSKGRNAGIWALITFVVGFGLQLGLPILAGIVLAVVWMTSGSTESEVREALTGPAMIIGFVSLVLSFAAVWLILWRVSRIPADKTFNLPPSPPTNFN